MGGHCIESEDFVIVVDKWDGSFLRRPGCKPHYFFLTHLHADHISGLTSTWSRTIYTSPFNAWLLPMRRNVKQILLREVELNVTHTIRKANNEIAFQVTLLDANHCPGAVMFLFQGKFGNILYTGDFRYTPRILENPVLSPIIRNKELSVLYLDNTYAAPTCKFPSREIALKQVLKIIDENPDSKILIGMRQLGKEEVLRAIALHVNEKVCVSNQRFQILSKLEYEDVFTTDISLSRIHAVELHTITQRHCQESTKTVSIKLTSMYECGNADKQRGNIYVVPYSDHSSHDELKEFVDHLRPLKLYPILIPKISKGTAVPGPWHRMSAVNCVVPEEILQLCGPAPENGAPSTTHPEIDLPQLLIKYHPASKPVSVEKKSSSVTYIDEGLNFVPFDSLGSHLTNNNKARKHIKASWTRLAPKLLTPKGVKFDSSPEKNSEPSQDSCQVARVMDESSSGILVPTRNKGDIPCDPSVKENSVIESDGTIVDLPLSDDDYDMPSSASELIRQLNLSASESVNGVGSEDRKSECSSVITDLFEDTGNVRMTRNRSKCESPAKGVNDSKDSVSDVSSSKRTTRSKASVTSVPVFSRPRTRLSHGSDTDSHVNNESPRKAQVGVRKSLRNSPNAQSPSPVSPKSAKNGLGRKSVSLESLPTKSTIKELKKVTKEVKDADIFLSPGSPSKKPTKVTNDSKNNACKIAECIPSPTGNVSPKKRVPVILETINVEEEHQKQNDSSSVSIVGATNSAPIGSSNVITGNQAVGTSSNTSAVSTDSSTENCNVPATVSKKTVNGNVFLSNFNGIHINSPGRKRVPLSCDWDAAQEIVKKETEQALKALECLNQMKGFKTRNRSGPAAQRRLSADNIPKSPAKKVASPGIRRRTASILSSMASTFSQQPETKEAATPSQPARCVQGISPILPDKDTRSPRKAKGGGPGKMGSGQKNSGSSKRKEPQLIPEAVESKAVAAGQSTYLSSVVKIENPMDVDVGVSQSADSEDLPSSVSLIESTEPVLLPKVESCVNNDSEVTSRENSRNTPEEPHVSAVVSNRDADDILNQGLFLTDETLASASSSSKKEFKQPRRTYYKKQTEVNVNLMKLKMDFAMSRKGPKRLSLPSRLSFLRRDYSSKQSMLQSKDKVQDWKNKISMRLRKSPQRRYKFKSPNKLRENAKRTLASILRSGRNLNSSQEYQGDVEDCTELSQPISEAKENSGYTADNEDVDSTQPSSVPTVHRQTRSSHQRTLSDSSASEDSKVGILNEVRRSSRLSKEDVNCFQVPSRPVKSLPKHNSKQENSKANSKGVQVETNPPQKKTGTLPLDNVGGPSAGTSVARFSSRLSERSQMASSKGTENVLAQKSPNILSLMADAFKNNTVSSEAPSTANILCSMAENFKRLDDATRVSPSLSIQLVSSKVPVSSRPPRDRNSTDWGVQITRVDSALSKSQTVSQNLSSGGLSVRNAIPKSLSIEIIPDSDVVDVAPRKGPSPPTVTISPEVIDLASDSSESQVDSTQSTIHSLPLSDGPRRLPQGGTRWPKIPKSEILSPPQAVWKEKRSSSQTGDNVIIDIQTQEDPQKVPHCPVHCTCGAAMRQGTCMGTMRNLIEEDADCLYEVPLSPEDFEECGAMLALGRGWIESCFDDPEDRDEFFQSYEDILPTVSDWKQRRAKSLSENSKSGGVQPAPQSVQPVRRVLSLASPKPTVQCVKHAPTAAAAAQRPLLQHTVVKNQTATSSQTKAPKTVPKINQAEEPKKKPSSCLKEIEKKIIAYNDEKSKKESERKSLPSRRTSSQSTSSSNSASRSRSSTKQSLSPIAPPPPKVKSTISKRKLNAPNSSNDPKEKKQKVNTSSSGSESPESKKTRCNELDRLSDIGKNSANRRYRVSVRRSLDHLMTRQKLRSDRRVKASNSSRS